MRIPCAPLRSTHAQINLPERVTIAVAELTSAAREGLFVLAVGTGQQGLEVMHTEDVAGLVAARAAATPTGRRYATVASPAR
jgi:hypothetical protein